MTARELRGALAALGWSSGQLGALLGCDGSLVRLWSAGRVAVPAPVGVWLRRAVRGLRSAGPPPVGWRTHSGYGLVAEGELVGRDGDLPEGPQHDDGDGGAEVVRSDGDGIEPVICPVPPS